MFNVLDGTPNGVLGFRTTYVVGDHKLLLEFHADGNSVVSYNLGNGVAEIPGPHFALKTKNTITIIQNESEVEILLNDQSFPQTYPCDLIGQSIGLYAAASPSNKVKGYFDNVGGWQSNPNQ